MMRYPRATRLAREANEVMAHRAGDPVSPGWRARRAWRILKDAADRGDHVALDVMWQVWLRHPDDEIWESLARSRIARPRNGPSPTSLPYGRRWRAARFRRPPARSPGSCETVSTAGSEPRSR